MNTRDVRLKKAAGKQNLGVSLSKLAGSMRTSLSPSHLQPLVKAS